MGAKMGHDSFLKELWNFDDGEDRPDRLFLNLRKKGAVVTGFCSCPPAPCNVPPLSSLSLSLSSFMRNDLLLGRPEIHERLALFHDLYYDVVR